MPKVSVSAFLDLSRSFNKIGFAHNVVSVKDAPDFNFPVTAFTRT